VATPYASRSFFRQVANSLLREYFASRSLLDGVNWDDLGETDTGPIYDAWLELPQERRVETDADFHVVHDLADEAGIHVMIEEADYQHVDLVAALGELEDFHDQAMWVFLKHPKVFDIASRFSRADSLPNRSWQKRVGLPLRRPDTEDATIARFRQALVGYYVKHEGRGHNCTVEPYKRGEQYYLFAYPEDHARAEQDYEGAALRRRPHRPAFDLVFVYTPDHGTLDVYAPGGRKVIAVLQAIFTEVILGAPLPDAEKDDRVFDLEPLQRRDFRWLYPPSSGIATVFLKRLRLSLITGEGERISVEGKKPGDVHDLYDALVGSHGKPGPFAAHMLRVTQAEVHVDYAEIAGRKPGGKDFRVTWPNMCDLGQDDRDAVLREMLIASGIDPSGLSRDAARR